MPRDTQLPNPLLRLVAHGAVGQEYADDVALSLLCWFDAAKRGQCTAFGCNLMTTNLIISSYIAAHTKSKGYHDIVTKAYSMLEKAAARPGHLLSLTTPEYNALRAAFGLYLRSLPMVKVGMLTQACATAEQMMGE
jgi:hypothetical protein